jgi:hypothetical protein
MGCVPEPFDSPSSHPGLSILSVSRGIRIGFIFSLDASDDDNPPATAIANLNLPQALMTPLHARVQQLPLIRGVS